MMQTQCQNNRGITLKQRGFTFVEMAVVLIISGLIIAAVFAGFTIYLKSAAEEKTHRHKALIETALNNYMAKNFALPCPAPIEGVPIGDPAYGQQTACLGGPVPLGTFRAPGARIGASDVHIGAIPAFDEDINLPAEVMRDGWGNLFTYAVTEDMTANNSLSTFEQAYALAAIEISENGQTLSPPDPGDPSVIEAGHIAYAIISHGPSGVGGFTPDGVRAGACPVSTLDSENCNNDAIFITSSGINLAGNAGSSAGYFDDEVSYAARVATSNWPNHQWCNPGTGVVTGVQFQSPDLSWGPCVDLRGPQGPQGPKGPTGDTGPPGHPGGLDLSDAACAAGEALRGFTQYGEKICVTNDGSVPDLVLNVETDTDIKPKVTVWNPGPPPQVTVNPPFATASCPPGFVRVSCSGARDEAVLDSSSEDDGSYIGTVDVGTLDCKTGVDFNGGIEAVATAYCLKFDY